MSSWQGDSVKVRDRSTGRRAPAGALQAVAPLILVVWLVCLVMLLAADGEDVAVRIAAVAGVGLMFAVSFVWGAIGRPDRGIDWEEFDRLRAGWQPGEWE